jgi:hypothetical protein
MSEQLESDLAAARAEIERQAAQIDEIATREAWAVSKLKKELESTKKSLQVAKSTAGSYRVARDAAEQRAARAEAECWEAWAKRRLYFHERNEAMAADNARLRAALRFARHELYDVQDATTPARRVRIGEALARIDAALKEPTS